MLSTSSRRNWRRNQTRNHLSQAAKLSRKADPPLFDLVIGNPPFIRYQTFTGDDRLKAIAAALRQGIRLNKLASAWAPFLIHACSFLKPEGRLGFVLPAELLSVNYAGTVRAYLMQKFSSLKIVTFEESVFPGVQEEIVVLLASGAGTTNKFELLQARNLSDLGNALGRRWPSFQPTKEGEKWTNAFIPEDVLALYRSIAQRKAFTRLGDWGRAYLGCVTGANGFFLLSAEDARVNGLRLADLTKICPPGSRHLRGVELTGKAWEHLRDQGEKVFVFNPASSTPASRAASYIASGQVAKVDRAYKCRVRRPWWRVPLVDSPSLFITYMNQEGVRLISNSAKVHITNSHYGLALNPDLKKLGSTMLPLGALNSLTLLASELEGRSYGGLLKIEPREVERLPVPSPEVLGDAGSELEMLRPQLASSLRQEKMDAVCVPVDEILLRNGLGLSVPEIRDIRRVRRALFERRRMRSKRPV